MMKLAASRASRLSAVAVGAPRALPGGTRVARARAARQAAATRAARTRLARTAGPRAAPLRLFAREHSAHCLFARSLCCSHVRTLFVQLNGPLFNLAAGTRRALLTFPPAGRRSARATRERHSAACRAVSESTLNSRATQIVSEYTIKHQTTG